VLWAWVAGGVGGENVLCGGCGLAACGLQCLGERVNNGDGDLYAVACSLARAEADDARGGVDVCPREAGNVAVSETGPAGDNAGKVPRAAGGGA